VEGDSGSTGSLPMSPRKDSLMCAMQILSDMEKQLKKWADPIDHQVAARWSSTPIQSSTSSPGSIARRVSFQVDIRHPSDSVVDIIDQSLIEWANATVTPCTLKSAQRVAKTRSRTLDSTAAADAAVLLQMLGTPHVNVSTWDLTDATNMQEICPCSVLVVPTIDGRTRHSVEDIDRTSAKNAADALLQLLLAEATDFSSSPATKHETNVSRDEL